MKLGLKYDVQPDIRMTTNLGGWLCPRQPSVIWSMMPQRGSCSHGPMGMGRYFCDHEMGDEMVDQLFWCQGIRMTWPILTHCQRFRSGPLKAHKRYYSYYSRYARGNFEIPDSQFSFILSADPYPTPHLYPSVTSPFKRWSTAEFHANQIPSTPYSHPLFSPVPKRKVLKVLAVALSKIHTIDIHRP